MSPTKTDARFSDDYLSPAGVAPHANVGKAEHFFNSLETEGHTSKRDRLA